MPKFLVDVTSKQEYVQTWLVEAADEDEARLKYSWGELENEYFVDNLEDEVDDVLLAGEGYE